MNRFTVEERNGSLKIYDRQEGFYLAEAYTWRRGYKGLAKEIAKILNRSVRRAAA